MNSCGAGVDIKAVKTGVTLNLKQMAVPADEDIRTGFVEQAANAFGIPPGAATNMCHAKTQSLNLPMQGFSGFSTYAVVVNVAKHHPNVGIELPHGVQNGEITHIACMPDFVAICQMMRHAVVPMAVGVR